MTETRDELARPRAPRWRRRCAIGAGVLATLFVLAWLAVPPIVRSQVESRATEALGRPTTLESVAFDPFRLRLTLKGLAIAGLGDAPPLATVDTIEADLSTASIWHRAPVLEALKLSRPAIALGRDRDGRPSVQDLLDRAAGAPPGPPPRFSLNNIEIDGGSIRLDDARAGRRVAVVQACWPGGFRGTATRPPSGGEDQLAVLRHAQPVLAPGVLDDEFAGVAEQRGAVDAARPGRGVGGRLHGGRCYGGRERIVHAMNDNDSR